jgi:hypothetical protein
MEYIALALVIIAAMAYTLVDKWLEQKASLNSKPVDTTELSAAIDVKLKLFDDRINNTWGTVSSIKEELNAIKLQNVLKAR